MLEFDLVEWVTVCVCVCVHTHLYVWVLIKEQKKQFHALLISLFLMFQKQQA